MKFTEFGEETPGWYRAQIDEYFLDKTCKIIYDDDQRFSQGITFISLKVQPGSETTKFLNCNFCFVAMQFKLNHLKAGVICHLFPKEMA